MSGNIQQQMYTRERGGIFHATDGYDTIAMSSGLDQTFVKKYLHPFCLYHAPKALSERGEKDPSLYPEAVTLFQPETGELVIGQAVFVPADFTGSRSTYFMHNYVIPAGRKDEWIKQPEKLFQITDFQTSYVTALGKNLPEREVLEYGSRAVKSELLATLGISEEHFKQLLFAVMSSIAGKKKVFISLIVPLKDYTKYALELLELIYLYLPYAHRRKLGAMTFTSEPDAKNYIHVMFFEPGTLNTRDRAIEKQYIFDFANSRISGVDLSGQQHEYLDFAMHQFSESTRMNDFFEFAEMALSGLPEGQKLELTSYYQLTAIFLTLTFPDAPFYEKNKIGFLQSLLTFLQVNSDEKPDLKGLFLNLIKEEKFTASVDYFHAVVAVNSFVQSDEVFSFLLETLMNYQDDPLYGRLWKTIEQDMPTHEALVMFMNEHSDYQQLFELYLNERFKQHKQMEDILVEVNRMVDTPYLLELEPFRLILRKKITSVVESSNVPIKSVLALKKFSIDHRQLKQDMLDNAMFALLRSIRLQDLTLDDIKAFGEIFTKEMNVREMKDARVKENYLVTNALFQLISFPSRADSYSLKPLTIYAREQIREILKRLLRDRLSLEQFPLLYVAFGTEGDGLDNQGVLGYLIKYSDDKTLLAFIREKARMDEMDYTFRRSLRSYFINHPKSIWKNKALRKELYLIKNNGFKRLLNEVETETASPVVKFLRKNGLKLLMALVIVGGVGRGVWFGLDYLTGKNDKPRAEKTSKTSVSTKKGTSSVADPINLDTFTKWSMGDPDQTVEINRAGKLETITFEERHPNGVLHYDQNKVWPIKLPAILDRTPFAGNGMLLADFSTYMMLHDFDEDKSPELVVVVSDQKSDSFVWIFKTDNLNSEGDPLQLIYTAKGLQDVQLKGSKLILPKGEQELVFEYSTEKKTFVPLHQ
ncbi:hypothetical protein BABA_01280 [Neobacillus bataviensis LMG 21833]|uniref:Glycosyltransferase n=1 Tax=Neobacillus bataviensis LMG 21833 TaxID=1117379 RepID=K6EDI6_9BACI|nr:hypothetical protein [Neobacillus bataviensis]EKN71491.1 hypothetical protein BABA_01280 [Neobacillus bataviensis LMG 21833]